MTYKCSYANCSCTFDKPADVRNHENTSHGGRKWSKKRRKSLKGKELTSNADALPNKVERRCPVCTRTFCSDNGLISHLTNHAQMKYRCLQPPCGWEFETFQLLYQHYYSRHNIKIRRRGEQYFAIGEHEMKRYRCLITGCGHNVPGTFAEFEDSVAHMETNHEQKYLKCSKCSRLLPDWELDPHEKYHAQLKYKCHEESCGWEFDNFVSLFLHNYTRHNITLQKDDKAKFSIRREENPDVVMRTETKSDIKQSRESSKGYPCPICHRQFTSQTKFNRHIENHNDMNYKCNQCGWEFKGFRYLQLHYHEAHKNLLHLTRADEPWFRMQKVDIANDGNQSRRSTRTTRSQDTEATYQYKYPCPFISCETGCDDFSQLEKHLRFIHKSMKGYCPMCGCFLRDRLKYRAHLERHVDGTTWYRCLYDGWMFDSMNTLQAHYKEDHKLNKILDEQDYDIVQDAIFGDDESTSAYEESSDSDVEIFDIKVESKSSDEEKKEPTVRKPADFRTLARRTNTHIKCAFCNETFDMEYELEEHQCYRDLFVTGTEMRGKPHDSSENQNITCTVTVHAPPSTNFTHSDTSNGIKCTQGTVDTCTDSSEGRQNTSDSGGSAQSCDTMRGSHFVIKNEHDDRTEYPCKINIECDDSIPLSVRLALGLESPVIPANLNVPTTSNSKFFTLPSCTDTVPAPSNRRVNSVDSGISMFSATDTDHNTSADKDETILNFSPKNETFAEVDSSSNFSR